MIEYESLFEDLPTSTLESRLVNARLPRRAADAYRAILAARAAFVPSNLSGVVSMSYHSGTFYVNDLASIKDYIIPDELAARHGLHDGDRVVFQQDKPGSSVSRIIATSSRSVNPPEGYVP